MLSRIIYKKFKKFFFFCFRFLNKNKKHKLVFVNSIPKSGTYFLHQILSSTSFLNDFGNFVASRPTLTYRYRSFETLKAMFKNPYKNEFCLGHLEYSALAHNYFKNTDTINILLVRDPRDIVISESFYLTNSNIFHKLHKFFKSLRNSNDRISFAMYGSSYLKNCDVSFESINQRYVAYFEWINKTKCYYLKYEDLIGENQINTIRKLLIYLSNSLKIKIDIDKELTNIQDSLISNKKPHTFRIGKKGRWKKILSSEQKKWFLTEMKDLLLYFGYEKK